MRQARVPLYPWDAGFDTLAAMRRRTFLQAVATTPLVTAFQRGQTQQPPNIVIIYADDMGYGDLHVYGSDLSTPNIDKLAGEGIRFTNWTSADPVCSPSR